MAEVNRQQVEERAYRIWQEAGCPEGSSLAHWLQAEIELGIIPRAEAGDPIVTLHELAVEARDQAASSPEPADEELQQAVEQSVPAAERLPRGSGENPLSEHVESIAQGQAPLPGDTTFEGGDKVQRPSKKRRTEARPLVRDVAG
jgi:hypothetical protein